MDYFTVVVGCISQPIHLLTPIAPQVLPSSSSVIRDLMVGWLILIPMLDTKRISMEQHRYNKHILQTSRFSGHAYCHSSYCFFYLTLTRTYALWSRLLPPWPAKRSPPGEHEGERDDMLPPKKTGFHGIFMEFRWDLMAWKISWGILWGFIWIYGI